MAQMAEGVAKDPSVSFSNPTWNLWDQPLSDYPIVAIAIGDWLN